MDSTSASNRPPPQQRRAAGVPALRAVSTLTALKNIALAAAIPGASSLTHHLSVWPVGLQSRLQLPAKRRGAGLRGISPREPQVLLLDKLAVDAPTRQTLLPRAGQFAAQRGDSDGAGHT
jgi:hypothetical protein